MVRQEFMEWDHWARADEVTGLDRTAVLEMQPPSSPRRFGKGDAGKIAVLLRAMCAARNISGKNIA